MKNVYLTGSVRTPIGRFGGTLASWTAADLGVAAANAALERANLKPKQIQNSIWGCARQAGGGPNVARQITYRAGGQLNKRDSKVFIRRRVLIDRS